MKVKFKEINQATLLDLLSIGLDVDEIARGYCDSPSTFNLTLELGSTHSLTAHNDYVTIYDTDDISSIDIQRDTFSEVVII